MMIVTDTVAVTAIATATVTDTVTEVAVETDTVVDEIVAVPVPDEEMIGGGNHSRLHSLIYVS